MTTEIAKPYSILDSKTIRWILGIAVAAACRVAVMTFGLPDVIPPDVQADAVLLLVMLLEVAGVGMCYVAAWFRVKAKRAIDGWRGKALKKAGP